MIKLSGYKIIKKIGSGGMGDVYLAEHEKLEKKVAIKSLHKNLVTDASFKKRFSQEAKTHSKLDHPNIIRLLDYKERKDGLFLIMEYVKGMQLDDHIKNVSGPIPENDLIILFKQILDAIGYAHKKGLVHRDIKPSNIMINNMGMVKVLDFGIAKFQDEENGLTKTGIQIGTAAYMSPEQVNAKKLDKLTDIYSLGITLFYMAVGKSPFEGETNAFSIQTKIIAEPVPLLRKIYPGVAGMFEEIISKATQKNKIDRYQSCEEFKNHFDILKNNSEKKENSESLNQNKKTKSNFSNTTFFFIALSFILLIFFIAKSQLNQSLIKENLILEKSLGIEKLSSKEKSIELKNRRKYNVVDLNNQISELKKKNTELENKISGLYSYSEVKGISSGENYTSNCKKREDLRIYNHTSQKLDVYIDHKDELGKWVGFLYWEIDSGQDTRLENNNSEIVRATDYRYYVTTLNGNKYSYSDLSPHISNVCVSSTIHIY